MQEREEQLAEPDIPVTILTGFLGAGKTTLLNRILSENHHYRIAVVENEFGEESIDSDLLVQDSAEQIVTMNNGCICCTIRGDLSRVLTDLRLRKDRGEIDFDCVVIETTGVANPGSVCQTFFMDDAVAAFYRLDGVVTVVDAKHANDTLDKEPEAKDQVAFADRIFITKKDLVTDEEYFNLCDRLLAINPRAPIESAHMGDVAIEKVLNLCGFNMNDILDIDPAFLTGTRHHHHHQDDVAAFVFTSERPFDVPRFEQYVQSLVAVYGQDMLRYKGVLYLKGTDHRCVFQGVHMVFGADMLGPWGSTKPESRIVIIGRSLPKEAILKGFETCLAEP